MFRLGWFSWLGPSVLVAMLLVCPSARAQAAASVASRVHADLSSGKDVVIASYVALWNLPKTAPARSEPDPYWDALYGHDTFFERKLSFARHLPFVALGSWTTQLRQHLRSDPVSIKVMAADPAGDRKGRIIVVYLAYMDREQAMRDMTIHLKTGRPPDVPGVSPSTKANLRAAYVVGYWGHNTYRRGHNPDHLEDMETTTLDLPRGVFVVGCQTALWYPQKVLARGIEPILFTSNKMPPEGYVAAALYDGLARGLDKHALRWHVARAVQVYHEMRSPPVRLFVNSWGCRSTTSTY